MTAALLLFSLLCQAQNDSLARDKWTVPQGMQLGYAGGFGMISGGVIFQLDRKMDLVLTAGYTPPRYGNTGSLNLIFDYKTMRIPLGKNVEFYPINLGAFLNLNVGKNIYLLWPEPYPKQYYWWNSALRFGPIAESELRFLSKKKQSASLFFQCLTNDLYIASYFTNIKTLALYDILVFGTGVKVRWK